MAKKDYRHLQGLYLSNVSKFQEELDTEILVRAYYFWQFQHGCIIRGNPDEPVAIQISLGWVLSGPSKCRVEEPAIKTARVNLINVASDQSKEGEVCKLWDLETLGIRSKDDAEVNFNDEISFSGVKVFSQASLEGRT